MIQVYHTFLRDPKSSLPCIMFFPTVDKVRAVFQGLDPDYHAVMVATVETDDFDEAYRLTNHIDKRWQENPEVTPRYPAARRSTSVGDVMVHGSRAVAVSAFGFDPL